MEQPEGAHVGHVFLALLCPSAVAGVAAVLVERHRQPETIRMEVEVVAGSSGNGMVRVRLACLPEPERRPARPLAAAGERPVGQVAHGVHVPVDLLFYAELFDELTG